MSGASVPGQLHLRKPYVIFMGDIADPASAKTGFGLRDWCPGDAIGQIRTSAGAIDLGLPVMTVEQAARAGARSVVIGIAPDGGALKESWTPTLAAAAAAGLDVVSGLHTRLQAYPSIAAAADAAGTRLINVRHPVLSFPVGTGRKRSGMRVLTVGTDCALGKKYTALSIAVELRARGLMAKFRATGQTGIMIAGAGIPIDAIVADFVAGAAEALSPDAPPEHWDVIEGQGSLFHPSYAAVTMGLVHGSQPDALVLCHDPRRRTIDGLPDFPLPPLTVAVRRYEEAARLTNPAARVVALSLNTSGMTEDEAGAAVQTAAHESNLPVTDPIRCGAGVLADALLAR
jgi:uncharacterized NAD-dependent epimerase/dehydratase family protein